MIQESIPMISIVTAGNYSFNQQIIIGIVYILTTITLSGEFIVY